MAAIALLVKVLIFAQICWAGDPQAYQPRPIPMGVSISTTPSLPYIFAGTAGMRVLAFAAPDIKFILSNNHVIGAIGPTLCPDTAPLGTWILQPGTLDIGNDPGNNPFYLVGVKFLSVPIDFTPGANNLVDAAIAFTVPSLADKTILDLGIPSPDWPAIAMPGMVVTKSGRTTGVTEGTVQAINVTALVSYDSCGTARFVYQFTVTPGNFSAPGDSGSVVLEKSTMKPVGLLFAGGSTSTIMNHILFVYLSLGVFVDFDFLSGDSLASPQNSSQGPEEGVVEIKRVEELKGIQERHEDSVMNIPGVVGIGIGLTEDGKDLAFIVYVEKLTPAVEAQVPDRIEGVPVRIIESGIFKAY